MTIDWTFLRAAPAVPMTDITRAVASRFSVPERLFFGRRRSQHIAKPRQVAMWLATLDGSRSLPEIGRFFNRDHTTVLHARKCVEGAIIDRREFGVMAEDLAREFKLIHGFHMPAGRPVHNDKVLDSARNMRDASAMKGSV